MKIRVLSAVAAAGIFFAGAAHALAPATIQTRSGESFNAYSVDADTVNGVTWKSDRTSYGKSLRPWEIEAIRYTGMDEFNGLARKMAGGLADPLQKDAEFVLSSDPKGSFSKDEWETNIRHACRYYIAHAHRIRGDYKKAIEAFELFLTECEKSPVKNAGGQVSYTSPISKKPVADAAGLHRLYLNGLEAYNDCLLRAGNVEDSRDKAIKALDDLTRALRSSEYLNWTMRALRDSADYAETKEDWASARQYYTMLQTVALTAGGSKPTRASMEAQLKVGFMKVKEKDPGAGASFLVAIRAWEAAHDPDRIRPTNAWISADESYFTAGCYVGQGLHEAAQARNAADWAKSLRSFSMSLAIFQADDQIRSMGLLGAAEASAKLAEYAKADATAASTHAKLAEKFLVELQTLLPKTRAASDKSIPEIQKLIKTYKKD